MTAATLPTVECPECGGPAPTGRAGRVLGHRMWRMGRGGMRQAAEMCWPRQPAEVGG
jgi:hypothetical protein